MKLGKDELERLDKALDEISMIVDDYRSEFREMYQKDVNCFNTLFELVYKLVEEGG